MTHMVTSGFSVPDVHRNLGGDIFLGGQYGSYPLIPYSSEWARYGSGWTKSGWLYSPEWSQSHAVAFFKIHKGEDGSGYVHICDVADPSHSIFLETSTSPRQTEEMSWSGQPNTLLWRFTWQAHNLAAIRRLIMNAFTAKTLPSFCQDRPSFEHVLNGFGANSSLEEMAVALIDYCRTRLLFPELLSEIHADNPKQYERHSAEIYRVG